MMIIEKGNERIIHKRMGELIESEIRLTQSKELLLKQLANVEQEISDVYLERKMLEGLAEQEGVSFIEFRSELDKKQIPQKEIIPVVNKEGIPFNANRSITDSEVMCAEEVITMLFIKHNNAPLHYKFIIAELEKFGYVWSKPKSAFRFIAARKFLELCKKQRGHYSLVDYKPNASLEGDSYAEAN